MNKIHVNRRTFLTGTAAAALAGCATPRPVSLKRMGYISPNEKLNIASIGAGGKASGDIDDCASENIVALCDPDVRRAGSTFAKYPNAKQYTDYRVMLEEYGDNIDAVIVSTPDHVHATASVMAMRMGKHIYVQKPLAHNVHECRVMQRIANEYNVATQMGNQGHSGEGVRKCCEMVWSGAIGDVREVHAWTNRPIWPQGIAEPLPPQEVPESIDWDVWLGPAPYRPYNEGYAPFNWRGWYDFGVGALGDMACHILDPVNWAMQLTAPVSVECIRQEGKNSQTYPNKSIIRFDFPQRGTMPPVSVYWYDGGLMPPRPEGVPEDNALADGDNGSLFIGDGGILTVGTYGGNPRLLPDSKMADYQFPEPLLTRAPEHHRDWLRACKGGSPACSNFDYSAPFTEWILLGTIALRVEGKLYWDAEAMKFTNSNEANQYLTREYRKGWELV